MSEIWDLLLSSLLSTCFISCVWIIFFSVRRLHGFRQAGRSTSLYLPEMNCEKHAKPSLEKAAKESECGPLRSPFNCPIAADKPQKQETGKQGTFFISWDEHDSSYVILHPVLQRNQHHRNPQMMSFISAYACPYATWYCKKSLRGLTPLRVLLTHEIVMTTALLNMNRRVFRLAQMLNDQQTLWVDSYPTCVRYGYTEKCYLLLVRLCSLVSSSLVAEKQ